MYHVLRIHIWCESYIVVPVCAIVIDYTPEYMLVAQYAGTIQGTGSIRNGVTSL